MDRLQNIARLYKPSGKRWGGALAFALFCWINLLATFPEIHHLMHCHEHDSGQTQRQECAVTLLTHGQVLASTPALVLPRPTTVFVEFQLPELPVPAAIAYPLPPGRGPPSFFS